LLEHSDLPGFSREEQLVLSVMVRGQRKSFPAKYIAQLPDELQDSTEKLTMLLRLSMVFNRGRSEQTDTTVSLKVDESTLQLSLPEGWLAQHPLTKADLAQEAKYLKKAGFVLKYQD
jgi:exopolyphosphatase/guanosine-5'-triphosphate,3'-diphosphate pyrophosphatase